MLSQTEISSYLSDYNCTYVVTTYVFMYKNWYDKWFWVMLDHHLHAKLVWLLLVQLHTSPTILSKSAIMSVFS